ncbi:hypothetical protein VPH35_001299 [Triticum aestivum]
MSTSTTINSPLLRPSPRRPDLFTSPWRSPHPALLPARLRAPSPPAPAPSPSLAQMSGRQMRSLWWPHTSWCPSTTPAHNSTSCRLGRLLGCFSGFSSINRACSPV